MNHFTILACFWISLVVILPAGLIAMILWAKKVYPKTVKYADGQKINSLRVMSGAAFLYMIPGILLFFLFSCRCSILAIC